MKRVLCLYRVSTLKQVDKKDDIPMQRRECMDFIEKMDDWEFYDERMEKGVSGYKVSANDRDIIIEIRELAEKKRFDVLLVFMFDRLGRKEDETPFLVKWFIDHGIEVWSTREGQQKLDNQVDRLMNYMRFWAASGESEKTSIRVKAAHTQMTQDGIWRGGTCPYGYKLVHNGRIGKKNRPLYDLMIDEDTAPVVQEIFDLIIRQGMGTLRTANYLNEKYPDPKKIWTAQTIRNMIRNPIYTGRFHMNDVLSEPNESLRLVSDEDVEFGKNAIAKRIPRKYISQLEADQYDVPEGATKASVFGATMLSGILYCGHCGKKLVGGYNTHYRAGWTDHRPIYRCYNGAVKAKACDGPTTYSGVKVDEAVYSAVMHYFNSVESIADRVWKEKARKQFRDGAKAQLRKAQSQLERLKKEQEGLKKELLLVVTGESAFDRDLLREMIDENQESQKKTEEAIKAAELDYDKEENRIKYMESMIKNVKDWAAKFDFVSPDVQKMIMARLIERIDIYRGYEMRIQFYIDEEEFDGIREETDSKMENVS